MKVNHQFPSKKKEIQKPDMVAQACDTNSKKAKA